jgi:hypothetical protein
MYEEDFLIGVVFGVFIVIAWLFIEICVLTQFKKIISLKRKIIFVISAIMSLAFPVKFVKFIVININCISPDYPPYDSIPEFSVWAWAMLGITIISIIIQAYQISYSEK